MSTRCCRHVEWIVQPSHKRYLYHCRTCSVIISHDIEADTWRISHDPEDGAIMGEQGRLSAFAALDYWMTGRETVFRHEIFVHPGLDGHQT